MQVAHPRKCNMQQSNQFMQLIMQHICNIDIKQLSTQALKRFKPATPIATNVQQSCCKVQPPCNDFVAKHKKRQSSKNGWQDQEKELIEWFHSRTDLPNKAFQLKDAVTITCPHKC